MMCMYVCMCDHPGATRGHQEFIAPAPLREKAIEWWVWDINQSASAAVLPPAEPQPTATVLSRTYLAETCFIGGGSGKAYLSLMMMMMTSVPCAVCECRGWASE